MSAHEIDYDTVFASVDQIVGERPVQLNVQKGYTKCPVLSMALQKKGEDPGHIRNDLCPK
jgi:hypothetical protein